MPTTAIPFSFVLAERKLAEQNEFQDTAEYQAALSNASRELANILADKKVLELFREANDFFFFATFSNPKGKFVYFMSQNGLEALCEPHNGATPELTALPNLSAICAAVEHGKFEVNKIIPALRFKIKQLQLTH